MPTEPWCPVFAMQVGVSVVSVGLGVAMLAAGRDPAVYLPIVAGVVGYWLPSPRRPTPGKAPDDAESVVSKGRVGVKCSQEAASPEQGKEAASPEQGKEAASPVPGKEAAAPVPGVAASDDVKSSVAPKEPQPSHMCHTREATEMPLVHAYQPPCHAHTAHADHQQPDEEDVVVVASPGA